MERRRNSEVMLELLDLDGRSVADVGSGDGSLARLMARHGATVVGIECSPRQLAAARTAEPVHGVTYVAGVAQSLALPDGSMDIVVFFNSLHHVPIDQQDIAMAEAARVLRPGGLVYVSEPVAEGPFFQLVRPVDDETEVRAHAYAVIKDADRHGLAMERELVYLHTVNHRDFPAFRARMVAIDASRESKFAANEELLRQAFAKLGRRTEEGWSFDQPTRVNLLRKR